MKYRRCRICGVEKKLSEFHFNKVHNGKTYHRHECKKCYNETKRNYRSGVSKYINDYKEKGACVKCGYSKANHPSFSPKALEFHHPQNNKEFAIGNAVSSGYGLDRIKKEIEKCVLVCARCHAEIHDK